MSKDRTLTAVGRDGTKFTFVVAEAPGASRIEREGAPPLIVYDDATPALVALIDLVDRLREDARAAARGVHVFALDAPLDAPSSIEEVSQVDLEARARAEYADQGEVWAAIAAAPTVATVAAFVDRIPHWRPGFNAVAFAWTPEGQINNCAVTRGDSERDCGACGGVCPVELLRRLRAGGGV